MLPLDDITVVAPFATRQLADLGARVIKIERPGTGDFARHYDAAVEGLCSYFVWLNRSKESLTLDIKREAARTIVRQLLRKADVFIQNLAPGTAARLGFGASALRAAQPRLIVCDITGYGTTGPYRDKKAYDQLVQCETGLVSITGSPDEVAKAGISAADIAAGIEAKGVERERGRPRTRAHADWHPRLPPHSPPHGPSGYPCRQAPSRARAARWRHVT